MLDALLDFVAPPRCVVCGVRASLPWCATCRQDVVAPTPGCLRCAGHHERSGCPLAALPVRRTYAATSYTGVVAHTVVAAKVGGVTAAWRPLGRLLAGAVPVELDVEAVVPVPTEPRRRRRRGIDHAAVLAREVGARLDRPVLAALRASRGTPDRGAGERSGGLEAGAIRPVRPVPAAVLLVDDVLTTGVTATAASQALIAAGARRLDLAVLARAGG